jgi:D-glycero-D-manno-heptose 1,7-bisphosphate phosphatase
MNQRKRAVFLDRDGVLNDTFVRDGTSYPPGKVDQVRILPGVPEAVLLLKQLGLMRIVVTNQPDVARGTQTAAEVYAINAVLGEKIALDEFRVCMHDTADNCPCRKPKPGMLLASAAEHDIDLNASFMVGDRSGDILAGAAAGCRTFLVARPYSKAGDCRPDFTVQDLPEAARIIVGLVKGS